MCVVKSRRFKKDYTRIGNIHTYVEIIQHLVCSMIKKSARNIRRASNVFTRVLLYKKETLISQPIDMMLRDWASARNAWIGRASAAREIFRFVRWENQSFDSSDPFASPRSPLICRGTNLYTHTHARYTRRPATTTDTRTVGPSSDNGGVTCWAYRQVTPRVLYSVYPLRRILSVGKFDFS